MKKGQGKRMLIGLIVVFALFQIVANSLGSVRGEYGVLIGLVVVTAIIIAEKLIFKKSYSHAARDVGLGRPNGRGIAVALGICVILIGSIIAFAWQTEKRIEFYDGWLMLVPGLFFQAGVAEETLFRGYLFGHIRSRHTFWKATSLAAIPFVLVHLILFYTLPWSLAGVSILLSVAISFPLSTLFEQSGNTIWAPALLHFIIQSVPKLIVTDGDSASLFPFFWIVISALVPLCVYAAPIKSSVRTIARPAHIDP